MVEVRRLDNFLESPGTDHYWCNGCRLWHYHTIRCPVPSATPTDPAAALIAAAEALCEPAKGDDVHTSMRKYYDLEAAVDAYRQSRQPQGVKPSEVEPGCAFEFAPDAAGRQDGTVYLRVQDENGRPMFLRKGDWEACYFAGASRIIPYQDRQIGRAHVWTPVTNAHIVCRLLLESKKYMEQ